MCCDLWGRKESDTTEQLNRLNQEDGRVTNSTKQLLKIISSGGNANQNHSDITIYSFDLLIVAKFLIVPNGNSTNIMHW